MRRIQSGNLPSFPFESLAQFLPFRQMFRYDFDGHSPIQREFVICFYPRFIRVHPWLIFEDLQRGEGRTTKDGVVLKNRANSELRIELPPPSARKEMMIESACSKRRDIQAFQQIRVFNPHGLKGLSVRGCNSKRDRVNQVALIG